MCLEMCIPTTMLAIAMRPRRLAIHNARFMSHALFNRPSPPSLPAHEQREFEELVRAAAAPASSVEDDPVVDGRLQAGEELHPDARKKASPEFEGDVNPRTGERGGPKTEPLKHGDWSYGGRATDF